jgi:hypothetical protein
MDEDGANRLLARRLGIREEEITAAPATTTHEKKNDDVAPRSSGNAFAKRLVEVSHRVEEASRTVKDSERAYLARMSGAWKDATQELAGKGGPLGMQCRWGSIALGLSHLNLGSDHVADPPDAAVAAGPIPAEVDLGDREVSSVLRRLMTHCDACRDMAKTIAALEDARRDWVGTAAPVGAPASEEHALASELLRERVEGVRLAKGWWTEKAKAEASSGGKPLLFLPPDSGTAPGIEADFLAAHFVPASNIGGPTIVTADGTGYRVFVGRPIYGRVVRQRDSVAVDALGPVIELEWAMIQPVSRPLARTPPRKKER